MDKVNPVTWDREFCDNLYLFIQFVLCMSRIGNKTKTNALRVRCFRCKSFPEKKQSCLHRLNENVGRQTKPNVCPLGKIMQKRGIL